MTDKQNELEPLLDDIEESAKSEENEPTESDAGDVSELMAINGAENETEDGSVQGGCSEEHQRANKSPSLLTAVFEWVEMFAIYLSIGIAILMIFIRHCPVNGKSMQNTLQDKDVLILSTFAYTPKNGDIIVCQSATYELDKPLVKRVIATEGQTVRIDYKNWEVTVDGVTLDEEYVLKDGSDIMRPSNYLPEEFTVPEGKLFVLGDHRNDSSDSRLERIGFIDERYVVGKVWLRVLPFSDFTVFD